MEGVQSRKDAAKRAAQTKVSARLTWADELELSLQARSRSELMWSACIYYNTVWKAWAASRGNDSCFQVDPESSPDSHLFMACVEYSKKILLDCDRLLDLAVNGKARATVLEKVYRSIGDAYPWLKDECQRQYNAQVGKFQYQARVEEAAWVK